MIEGKHVVIFLSGYTSSIVYSVRFRRWCIVWNVSLRWNNPVQTTVYVELELYESDRIVVLIESGSLFRIITAHFACFDVYNRIIWIFLHQSTLFWILSLYFCSPRSTLCKDIRRYAHVIQSAEHSKRKRIIEQRTQNYFLVALLRAKLTNARHSLPLQLYCNCFHWCHK